MTLLSEADRVALSVFDSLLAKYPKEVAPDRAAALAQEVRAELRRHPHTDELFVVGVTDHSGGRHAFIAAKPPAGAMPLIRLNIRDRRIDARRELKAELRVDLACDDEGTEV